MQTDTLDAVGPTRTPADFKQVLKCINVPPPNLHSRPTQPPIPSIERE